MNFYLCVIASQPKRQLPVLGNAPKKLNTKKTPPRMPVARPLRACRQSSSPEPLLQTAAVSVPQGKETEESNPSAVVSTQLNINKELEALKAEMKQAKIERDLQAQMYKDQLAKVEAEYAAFKASREIHATPAPVAAPATPVTSSCPPAQYSQHQHAMTPQYCGIMPQYGGSMSHFGGSMSHFGGSMPQFAANMPQYGGNMSQFGGMQFAPYYGQPVNDIQAQMENDRAHIIILQLQQELQNVKQMHFIKYGSGGK